MKYRLSTKYKMGIIETDTLGIIINGGSCFKEEVGKTLTQICEKYYDKRIQVKLEKIDEY
jgi:hypothetical protein